MVQLPQDTPAANGDGDVVVRVTYDTAYGECTTSGTMSEFDLDVLISSLEN
jgi:hypothetical protein